MSPPQCSRCDNSAAVHMPDTPRCHACFAHYLHRSFKTSLGRLHAGGRRTLALALSSGESSAAATLLLHAYHLTLNPHPRQPPPHIHLIHISNISPPVTPPSLSALQSLLTPYSSSLSVHVASLPSATTAALARLTDSSDRLALMRAATLRTLAAEATRLHVDLVVLGTSATRGAADVLLNAAAGRGSAVSSCVQGSVTIDDVRFIRPLRGVPRRLLVRFARNRLSDVVFDPDTILSTGPSRLHDIVDRFVDTVASDNAASVHNVVRVAERLLPMEKGLVCDVCGHVIEKVAGVDKDRVERTNGDCKGCDNTECRRNSRLCMGCHACAQRADQCRQDGDNPVLELAQQSYIQGRRRVTVEEMRESIQDFLL